VVMGQSGQNHWLKLMMETIPRSSGRSALLDMKMEFHGRSVESRRTRVIGAEARPAGSIKDIQKSVK
jgi:hypothetical protein